MAAIELKVDGTSHAVEMEPRTLLVCAADSNLSPRHAALRCRGDCHGDPYRGGAFINQVGAFINNGSLTQAQGQELIDAANVIRTSLGLLTIDSSLNERREEP